jgi:hypothetical protein
MAADDLEESELGFKVTIRHSKTDQEGMGQTIATCAAASPVPLPH